ncbi:MAG TPA: radical SAM protein [candidate division Zixibacteria bacterium]|nr:radical SAM protein [candidate division Zixibacteria bacterium]
MNALSKLELFSTQMDLEVGGENEGRPLPLRPKTRPDRPEVLQSCARAPLKTNLQAKQESLGITQAVMPGGKSITLLKTLLTSACERNCFYCPFRAGQNYRRATFTPDEMASTFMTMYRAGMVEGLFLSSGIIKGGVSTQDRLIDTAEILRNKHNYTGYLHLKIMPGAEKDQVRRSMQMASRVSVNLEGPNTKRLALLAPKKIFFEELLEPLKWVEEIRRSELPHGMWNERHSQRLSRRPGQRWPSSTTQFVVGAVGESDLELLSTTAYLYENAGLSRTYYMAFRPVPGTPLEDHPPEDPWRRHRLYQASFLLRDYGFDMEELPFDPKGDLSLTMDPKQSWALDNLSQSPVEVNQADRELLLRVPGIGPKGARSILQARRNTTFRQLGDLKMIGVNPGRPAPFVLLDGKRPDHQLRLPLPQKALKIQS